MKTCGPLDGRSPAAVFGLVGIAFAAMVAHYLGLSGAACFDVAWTASAAAAVVGTLAARTRARPENRARWTCWSLASASWLLGQIAWNVYGVVGFPNSPNLADIGWWGFALLVTASMLRLPRGSRSAKLVASLESLPLIFAAIALCLAELWSTAAHSHLGLTAKISDLVYPSLYVSATILILQAMLGGALKGLRATSLRLVLAGITAQAVGFILWSSQLLNGTYVPGSTLLDPVWVLGLGAMGVGGLLAARHPEPSVEPREEPHTHSVILPAITFLLLFGALVAARIEGTSTGRMLTLELGLLCCGAALVARSSLLGRMMSTLLVRERAALANLAERESELARLNEQLLEDSRRDPLTGIGNRRALSDDLPMFQTLQREGGERIALALCDVDHFKSYNDRLGHLAGDQALRMIASTARGALRSVDTAYRFGGEELLLVLRDVSTEAAMRVAERVRSAVEGAAFPHPEGQGHLLTVSIGVASGNEDVEALLARADAALYRAKRLGRNRVQAAEDNDPAGPPSRSRQDDSESPVPRHLRSMLAVSRAAAAGQGMMPVVEALAETIRSELSFHVVVVNLLEADAETTRVVVVLGDQEARRTLYGKVTSLADWERVLAEGQNIHGAAWLQAGTYEWEPEGTWTPPVVPSLASDAWHPDDMLLLPLRGAAGEILGMVSVDLPVLGRRPTEAEIGVLVAVVDHAGLALDQVHREGMVGHDGSDELRLAAVMLLAETLDLRDPGTALHSRTVGQLARRTALALGLSQARIDRIHAAGVLHDLGKLGIADAVLHKPGALDENEWREIRRHPEVGAQILEHAGMRDIAAWVRAHHERIDGRGYPAGIAGARIPLEARILAVADAYEAMISDRPYRLGLPREEAREELARCAGTQFDLEVVTAFLRALEDDPVAPPAASEPLESTVA
jgi:diguanylate cyclase (GGDEF)-like protein